MFVPYVIDGDASDQCSLFRILTKPLPLVQDSEPHGECRCRQARDCHHGQRGAMSCPIQWRISIGLIARDGNKLRNDVDNPSGASTIRVPDRNADHPSQNEHNIRIHTDRDDAGSSKAGCCRCACEKQGVTHHCYARSDHYHEPTLAQLIRQPAARENANDREAVDDDGHDLRLDGAPAKAAKDVWEKVRH